MTKLKVGKVIASRIPFVNLTLEFQFTLFGMREITYALEEVDLQKKDSLTLLRIVFVLEPSCYQKFEKLVKMKLLQLIGIYKVAFFISWFFS